MKLDIDKGKKWRSPILKKKIGSSIKYENVVKMMAFRLFLKNGSKDFDETWSEC